MDLVKTLDTGANAAFLPCTRAAGAASAGVWAARRCGSIKRVRVSRAMLQTFNSSGAGPRISLMRDFLNGVKLLLLDLASTLFFLVLFLTTHNIVLSVSLGMALGLVWIGIQFVRRKPIHTMQWLSLLLTLAAGTTTLLTNTPRFVLLKPSIIYAIAGVVMLKRGWLSPYLPAIARAVAPDVANIVGYVWAGLMFVSAAVNACVALTCSLATWALTMPIFGSSSKMAAFLFGFTAIRMIVVRRVRAMPASERNALLALTGRR